LFADPALAADPRPPQLQITFLSEPAPIVQCGSTKLVYEMVVTNFSKRSYVFDSIDAKAGGAPFSFSGTTLTGMMAHLGPWDPVAGPQSRTIAAPAEAWSSISCSTLGPTKCPLSSSTACM